LKIGMKEDEAGGDTNAFPTLQNKINIEVK
jgi:hypothetical protein